MFNLGSNSQPMNNNGALNLGAQPQQNMFAQQQSGISNMGQNPFMQGMTNGQSNQWGQQAVAPPSEIEIQIMLLRGIVPVDRFIASPQMGMLVEMLSTIVSYSTLEILRNATFVINEDDGTMSLDVTKLPQQLQTISTENVKTHFTSLQNTASQNINNAENQQQQLAVMAQQSVMGGALAAAMADEGMMNKVGGGIGNVARSFLTGGR
tara:strand:+ start:1250 stop:1873 length:624 start_codon:yes stop_codon:yes gene_type:complete